MYKSPKILKGIQKTQKKRRGEARSAFTHLYAQSEPISSKLVVPDIGWKGSFPPAALPSHFVSSPFRSFPFSFFNIFFCFGW